MKYNPDKHHRRSVRLKGYDYTQAGAYFITICAQNRECLFGDVVDGEMRLNEIGLIVRDEWLKTAILRPSVVLDEYVVMPNHIHGVIIITDDCRGTLHGRGTLQRAPTIEQFGKPTSNSIPTIVRLFKSATTKRINEHRGTPGMPVWQRNYYEHIIRNDASLNRIRQYIVNNPIKWGLDRENPVVGVGLE
ncbi:transposase [Meiothermus ruber]|uniref:transposase n=1 Tax=Meiothermus ruber TaxID=277 RepID=UPI000562A62A|nr:transposase [Meiothermus ruber]